MSSNETESEKILLEKDGLCVPISKKKLSELGVNQKQAQEMLEKDPETIKRLQQTVSRRAKQSALLSANKSLEGSRERRLEKKRKLRDVLFEALEEKDKADEARFEKEQDRSTKLFDDLGSDKEEEIDNLSDGEYIAYIKTLEKKRKIDNNFKVKKSLNLT